jgi:hypothetical protein
LVDIYARKDPLSIAVGLLGARSFSSFQNANGAIESLTDCNLYGLMSSNRQDAAPGPAGPLQLTGADTDSATAAGPSMAKFFLELIDD